MAVQGFGDQSGLAIAEDHDPLGSQAGRGARLHRLRGNGGTSLRGSRVRSSAVSSNRAFLKILMSISISRGGSDIEPDIDGNVEYEGSGLSRQLFGAEACAADRRMIAGMDGDLESIGARIPRLLQGAGDVEAVRPAGSLRHADKRPA